jgi:hypothetical protein
VIQEQLEHHSYGLLGESQMRAMKFQALFTLFLVVIPTFANRIARRNEQTPEYDSSDLGTQLGSSLTDDLRKQGAGKTIGFKLTEGHMPDYSKVPANILPVLQNDIGGSHSVYGVAKLDDKGGILNSQAYHMTLDRSEKRPDKGADGRYIWDGHPTQSNQGFDPKWGTRRFYS